MKSPTRAAAVLALVIAASGIAASAPALADSPRGHARFGVHGRAPVLAHGRGLGHGGVVRFGVFVAAPVVVWRTFYGPPPYYYSSPYYPPVVAVPVSPPTYIEQGQVSAPPAPAAPAAATAPQPGYWYYCNTAGAYYPNVKQCPGGWQRVAPQPPSG